MQGPQYIVGRSNPPANGTPERRKVGKFHSKGLKTSFRQSLRRSKHEWEAGPASINRVGGPGGEFAHPSKGTRRSESESKERQTCRCPCLSALFCPSKIGPSVCWGEGGQDRPALSMVEGRGHGAVVQGIAYAQVLFAPGTRSSHPWDLYAPTCVASTGASDRASRDEQPDVPTGRGSGLHAWAVPICMTFL